MGIILFSLLLPWVFFALAPLQQSATVLFEALFWITSFGAGILLGLQFPLATKIYLHAMPAEATIGTAAGLIYGVDLLGGFVGGLFGGILLLPVLGLRQTCLLMAPDENEQPSSLSSVYKGQKRARTPAGQYQVPRHKTLTSLKRML